MGGGKTLLVLVTPEGKERHKDMLHPLEGLLHLSHVSGQGEREAREGSPAVSNGERARASRMLCFPSRSPYRRGGTCPPNGCVSDAMGGEDARQGFSGPLSIAPLGLLMEKKSGSRSGLQIVSFLQQGARF